MTVFEQHCEAVIEQERWWMKCVFSAILMVSREVVEVRHLHPAYWNIPNGQHRPSLHIILLLLRMELLLLRMEFYLKELWNKFLDICLLNNIKRHFQCPQLTTESCTQTDIELFSFSVSFCQATIHCAWKQWLYICNWWSKFNTWKYLLYQHTISFWLWWLETNY